MGYTWQMHKSPTQTISRSGQAMTQRKANSLSSKWDSVPDAPKQGASTGRPSTDLFHTMKNVPRTLFKATCYPHILWQRVPQANCAVGQRGPLSVLNLLAHQFPGKLSMSSPVREVFAPSPSSTPSVLWPFINHPVLG